jgi:hypothetical protein
VVSGLVVSRGEGRSEHFKVQKGKVQVANETTRRTSSHQPNQKAKGKREKFPSRPPNMAPSVSDRRPLTASSENNENFWNVCSERETIYE